MLEAAPELQLMITTDSLGPRPLHPQELAGLFLGPNPVELPERVGDYLQRARECMAYSGHYYPFLTIGMGQLGLVAEAALEAYASKNGVAHLKSNGEPKPKRSLIQELRGQGLLSLEQESHWNDVLKFRNYLSHPEDFSVLPFGEAVNFLNNLTYALLELFPEAHYVAKEAAT